MKILCIIDSLGSGGAQRQLVELAKGFKNKEHEVLFLVYRSEDFFQKELVDNDIMVHTILESNYIRRLIKMRKFIRNENCDAIVSFLEASNFISEISGFPSKKWKLIVGERSANPAMLKSFKLKFFRFFHIFADYIVSNSYSNIELVKNINPFISASKLKVIYNIVDFEKWRPKSILNKQSTASFQLGVIASHQYLKNGIGLIEAINLLEPIEKSRLKVYWYGGFSKDNSYIEVKGLIEKYSLDSLVFLKKPISNIEMVFAESDAIGLFSLYEGLPNVICEGMAMSKAIISSNISDLPDLLGNNEECLFDPKNVEDIKNSLSWILSLTKQELLSIGAINRTKAKELFNKDRIIEAYIELIKN